MVKIDIEMPKSCGGCFMRHYDNCYATKKHKAIPMNAIKEQVRAKFCPLKECE